MDKIEKQSHEEGLKGLTPERGAIKQCIAYCFGKMWANRGSNYLPERVDTAAESELAALEAEIGVLRAQLAKRDEDTVRMDWMQTQGAERQCWTQCDIMPAGTLGRENWGRERWSFRGQGLPNNTAASTLREAIDAARADASKERKDVV